LPIPLPSNRAQFSLDDVMAATGGVWQQRGACNDVVGISTNTRTLTTANAFVALEGPSFDGHNHVEQACQQGASLVIVSRPVTAPRHVSVVHVPDPRQALGQLALAHRRRWSQAPSSVPRTLVAVAGSAGKTTTRRAIACLLAGLGRNVHYAAGNFNNAIGVPLVLLGLEAHHDTAVVEIGTSQPGEVAYGVSLAEPDIGVLTLVAMEHGEGLGTLDAIADEEGDLLALLPLSALVIVNGDDPRCVDQLRRSQAAHQLLYGKGNNADIMIQSRLGLGLKGSRVTVMITARGEQKDQIPHKAQQLTFTTPLLGEVGAYATGAALTVAWALSRDPLTSESVSHALAPLADERDGGRLVPYELSNGTILIDDSYNANTASMQTGISTALEIASQGGRRLVLVLGEMRELGTFTQAEHLAVGALAAEAHPAMVIAVGGNARLIADHVLTAGGHASFALDVVGAEPLVMGAIQAGDVVLVKGSRGVGLDVLVQHIREKHSMTP